MDTHKLLFTFLLTTIVVLTTAEQPKQKEFKLSISVTGFKDSTEFYLINIDSTREINSALLLSGKLAYNNITKGTHYKNIAGINLSNKRLSTLLP